MNAQDPAIPHFPLLEELHVSTRAGAVPVQVFQWCSRARSATVLSDVVRAGYAAALALHAELAHARSFGSAAWQRRAAAAKQLNERLARSIHPA
jgi:hypothetical protein